MAKFSWKNELTDRLCDAILTLKTTEEVINFLEDIATIAEIKDLSQRLEIACLLSKHCTHREIAERTKGSSATISRVKKCLDYGAGGYKIVLERTKPSDGK